MALTKGVNSYVTVAEANTYLDNKLDVAAWTSAADLEKAQALCTATSMLDGLNWIGVAVSDSQALSFPRSGNYFDPRIGLEVVLDEVAAPQRIIDATIEQAYHLLNNDGLNDDTGSVRDLSIGSINLSNVRAASKFSPIVERLIKPLRANSSNAWWRAN
jgi:hypothetical protein